MTNGTKIEINATGTQLRFKPGVLLGGSVEHDCPVGDGARSVSWYLEGIMPLAPFGKEPLELTLNGITDGTSDVDPSCDYLSASFLPLYIKFGVGTDDALPPPSIRVTKRGAAPLGCGRVQFYCPIVKELTPIELVDFGKVKRVRGNAISCRIPPSSAARVAHSAKGVMHRLLPDVWIHTDAHSSSGKRNKDGSPAGGCGPSPGLSVILTATTTEGVCISAECSMNHNVDSKGNAPLQNQQIERKKMELPEDLGKRSATMLLHEIFCGGCIDTSAQTFALLMMCLTPEDVSRIRLGPLSSYTVVSLRLFKEAFGVEFKLRVDEERLGGDESDSDDEVVGMESSTVLCSCLGIGYRNMARAST
jgi:RNA 3'-terminal phosphate cyclase-like protein